MLELTYKNFKVAIIAMLMDMKGDMLIINEKEGNITTEIENTKKKEKWKI